MEKEIIVSLENKDTRKARELILGYERKISDEKAVYTRSKMIEKLGYFKKIYNSLKEGNNVEIGMEVIDKLRNIENDYAEEITNKMFLKDKKNTHIKMINLINTCDPKKHFVCQGACKFNDESRLKIEQVETFRVIDCEIWNCFDSIIENLIVEQTIQIEDTSGCTIQVEAKQIRIKDSSNLDLFVYVYSGISIENCHNIRIFGINDGRNKFESVNDFSDPFSSKNYLTRSIDQKNF